MKDQYHILSLGVGVQSTALYLMFAEGRITPQIDSAIFADTQEEPAEVYHHLDWLLSLGGPPILCRSAGKLGDDLRSGRRVQGAGKARFASIPAFTTSDDGKTVGITRRQCSKEYKTEVIERTIRREVLNLMPRQRIPKTSTIFQYLGMSYDEMGRASRVTKQFLNNGVRFIPKFPLIDRFMTRGDCVTYLSGRVPHTTPRSACCFCPYHTDLEWNRIKTTDPEAWERVVSIDDALRTPGIVVNRDMASSMFLHRSCQPISLVQFDLNPKPLSAQTSINFAAECTGMCGV